MKINSLFDQIKTERDTFRTQEYEVIPNYRYNQWQTLNRIELYYNSQFEKGPKDPEGYDKYFYNITRPVVLTAEKAIDLDTKDIRPIPDDDASDLSVWFLGKETRQYLRDNNFGTFLNKMGNSFPKYGTILAKKVGDEYMPVNLMTLINDQRVDTLYDATYVTEEHQYNIADIVRLSKEMPAWENMDVALQRLQDSAEFNPTLKFYERRGIGPKWWFDSKSRSTDLVRGFAIVADIDATAQRTLGPDGKKLNKPEMTSAGFHVFQAVTDDFPYQERHWDKIPGRWLGVGESEIVFDPQVRRNELSNIKSKALWWKSKIVLWTADEIIQRNLLTDVQNGEIISSKNGINSVQFNNNDLTAFKEEQDDWDKNVQQNTFSFDSQIGENLPSGTPFSLAALLAGKSGEFFAKKREEFGLFVRDIMVESVIPSMMKSKKDAHIYNFSDEDSEDKEHLVSLAVITEAQKAIEDKYAKDGSIPTDEEVNREVVAARNRLASRRGLYTKLKKSFYEKAKYHFDYVITNEQIDLASNLTSLSNLLVNIGKNPQVLDDPRVSKLLSVIMRKAGVSPTELGFDKRLAGTVTQTAQGGGLTPVAVPPQGGPAQQFINA